MDIKYYFDLAAKAAMPKHLEDSDVRGFVLGAVGLRSDNCIVFSKNGAVHSTSTHEYKRVAMAHAEARLCRKMGKNGTVFVVRLARKDRSYVMSRPCASCASILKAHNVQRVYYSVNFFQYGIFFPQSNFDVVLEF